jgi:hypothetical protein
MKKMAIKLSGRTQWPRFVITDGDGRFWDGQAWTDKRQQARLYTDDQEMAMAFRELEADQFKDKKLRMFAATINVQVRADQDIDIKALRDYLRRAVWILIDQDRCGTGPVPESLVQIDVCWGELRAAD